MPNLNDANKLKIGERLWQRVKNGEIDLSKLNDEGKYHLAYYMVSQGKASPEMVNWFEQQQRQREAQPQDITGVQHFLGNVVRGASFGKLGPELNDPNLTIGDRILGGLGQMVGRAMPWAVAEAMISKATDPLLQGKPGWIKSAAPGAIAGAAEEGIGAAVNEQPIAKSAAIGAAVGGVSNVAIDYGVRPFARAIKRLWAKKLPQNLSDEATEAIGELSLKKGQEPDKVIDEVASYAKQQNMSVEDASKELLRKEIVNAPPTIKELIFDQRLGISPQPKGHPNIEFVQRYRDLTAFDEWWKSPRTWLKAGGPEGEALYRISRNFEDSYRQQANEWIERWLSLFRGMEKGNRIRVAKALNGDIKPSELPADLKAVHDAARGILDEVRDKLGIKGIENYYPHVWGFRANYKLTVNDETIDIAKSEYQAAKLAREYLKDHPDAKIIIKPVQFSFDPSTTIGMTSKKYWKLADVLSKLPGIEISKEDFPELTKGIFRISEPPHISRRFFGNLQERVRNLETFEQDPLKVTGYFTDAAKKIYGDPYVEQAEELIRRMPAEASHLKEAAERYVDQVMGRPDAFTARLNDYLLQRWGIAPGTFERAMAKARAVNATLKLGWNPSSALLNMTQTFINTYPKLGAKYTRKGFTELLKHSDETKRLLQELGIDLMEPKTLTGAKNNGFLGSFYMFNGAEHVNRGIAGLGAYRYAREVKKLPHEQAIEFAKDFIDATQFRYSAADLPRAFTNPISKTMLQFKLFLTKELEYISQLRGKEWARFIGAMLATGGVAALPGVQIADSLFEKMTGTSLLDEIQKRMPRLSRGVPGLLNVDMSERVGVGTSRDFDVSKLSDLAGSAWETLYGSGSAFMNMVSKYRQGNLTDDDIKAFLEEVMPVQARYAMNAIMAAANKGKVIDNDRLLYELSSPELFLKFLGLRTVRESEMSRLHREMGKAEEEYTAARRNWIHRIVDNIVKGKPKEQIQRDFERAREAGIVLDGKDLVRELRQRGKTSIYRHLESIPKALRIPFIEEARRLKMLR